ncbi:discoidin domain-containing protein [Nonomuraea thailandensis]
MTPLLRRLAAFAALVVTVPLMSAPPAHAADPLLSQGRPVTASSTESAAAFPASAAVDGDPGTRWSSAFSDPQWIQVDLGATAAISQVELSWEAAYATAFQVQASTDGATWSTLHSTAAGAGGNQTLAVSGSGRYVRVHGTQRATPWGYSLWEFKVYGAGSSGGERLLSYGKPGVASSSQHDGNCWECTPARAFDLDPASRWATAAWSDPGWIQVDLGATAQISKVVLQWDPAYARSFQIQTSPDASTWTTVYSTTGGTGFKQTLNVSGTGRYVRMYGTQRAGPTATACGSSRCTAPAATPPPRPPRPRTPPTRRPWCGATSSTAPPAPGPTPPSGGRTPAPARTTSWSTTPTTATPPWTARGTWSWRPANRPRRAPPARPTRSPAAPPASTPPPG